VVVVGAASMDIPRGSFYMKEVDVRISRSYGPGRYDTDYEKDGLDYPIGYVRWTENRNMQAFLQLAAEGRVDTQRITTHRFPVERAEDAYRLIEGEKTEPYVGIVLTYDDVSPEDLAAVRPAETESAAPRISPSRSSLRLGFIGAGSFAAGYLLPHLKALDDVTLDTVCNRSGLTGADMRNKFGFMRSTTDAGQVFGDENIGTVFIATRHGEHARFTHEALLHGQHVFVEKPLALNEEELAAIEALITGNPEMRGRQLLMVGYNRRFAPLVTEMKDFFASTREPAVVHYYVNAGFLPKDHWTQDLVDGGGRIIGEGCHFIDTIQFLTGAQPVRVSADCAVSRSEAVTNFDNVNITLQMSDGSLGIVTYVSNGDGSIGKERIVMSAGNSTAVMDNFQVLTLARAGRQRSVRSNGDKGHQNEVRAFLDAIRRKLPELIPYDGLFTTTRATFAAVASLNRREPVDVGAPTA
jgi:predicted dehydrogenase